VEPSEIAAAVLRALERPRREVWVPRSGRATMTITRLLPTRLRALIAGALGKGDVFLQIDPDARREYESRVAAADLGPEQVHR
jgi:hypothetical protein